MAKKIDTRANTARPLLEVASVARYLGDEAKGTYLEFRYRRVDDKKLTTTLVPAELQDHPGQLLRSLRAAGALLPERAAALKLIGHALSSVGQAPVRLVIDATGWHNRSFVFWDETLGSDAGKLEHSRPKAMQHGRGRQKGTLEAWKAALEEPCRYSPELIFGISAAFAAPIEKYSCISESAVFLFSGKSGTGKTTASRAGISVSGYSGRQQIPTFDYTGRALEELCSSFNDTLLVIDDVERASDGPNGAIRALEKIAYSVPSGVGRKRSSVVQSQGLSDRTWRVLVLTSWEESFYRAADKANRKDGQRARLIEIPVRSPKKGGIFSSYGGRNNQDRKQRKNYIRTVERTIRQNYGLAIKPYIENLLKISSQIARIVSSLVAEFVDAHAADGDGLKQRVAAKFGLVCAGGKLAARFGVAPFTEAQCEKACGRLFRRSWSAMSPHKVGTLPVEAFVRRILDAAADSEIIPIVEVGKRFPLSSKKALGLARTIGKRPCILIRKNDLHKIMRHRVSPDLIDKLEKRGVLIPSPSGKKTRQVAVSGWPGGGRPRFYCFDADRAREVVERRQEAP